MRQFNTEWEYDERASIIAAAEETRVDLDSIIEYLGGVLKDWGYEYVDNWWRDGKESREYEDGGPH